MRGLSKTANRGPFGYALNRRRKAAGHVHSVACGPLSSGLCPAPSIAGAAICRLPFAVVSLLLCLGMPARAQGNGLAFLTLDPDPAGQAAGGAYTASATGPFAPLFNPAGLASGDENGLALTFQDWIGGARTFGVAGRFGLGERVGAGLYVLSTSSGDLEAREGPGPSEGTFEVQYFAVGAAIARRFGPVQIGVAGKILSERVFNSSASGFAFDGGVQLEAMEGLRVGGAVQHLGDMNELETEATPLPTTFRGGVSIRPFRLMAATESTALLSTALHAEVVYRSEQTDPTQIHVGGEATLFDMLTLRGGHVFGDPVRSVSVGAGLAVGAFQLDYAMLPLHTGFGTGQLISLRYSW